MRDLIVVVGGDHGGSAPRSRPGRGAGLRAAGGVPQRHRIRRQPQKEVQGESHLRKYMENTLLSSGEC